MTEEEMLKELDYFNGEHIQPNVDILDEYMYPIQAFMKYMNGLDETMGHYNDLLSYCDQATSDLLHHIEFDNPSAATRAKLYKKLANIRRARRAVKNHLWCIQVINSLWDGAKRANLQLTLTGILKRIKQLEAMTFHDRTSVLKDFDTGGENDGP